MASIKGTQEKIVKVFNLLRPQAEPPTAWDNVHDWVTGKAKIVMIVAEILIALVFVGKVLVDMDAKALDEGITSQDKTIKEAYSQYEPGIRLVQEKSKSYAALWKASSKYAEIFEEVTRYVGNSEDLVIAVNRGVVTITGFGERSGLTDFEIAMRNSPNFFDVELFEVKAEGTDFLLGTSGFGLRAKVKNTVIRKI